jgi:hypothetical protein
MEANLTAGLKQRHLTKEGQGGYPGFRGTRIDAQ